MPLNEDLATLGFSFAITPDPDGVLHDAAVREFQRYASMEFVARDPGPSVLRYWARLERQATENHRYSGPINGNADAATLALIAHWKANQWRCPVVVLSGIAGTN